MAYCNTMRMITTDNGLTTVKTTPPSRDGQDDDSATLTDYSKSGKPFPMLLNETCSQFTQDGMGELASVVSKSAYK